jgi:D-alanine-D-alanine ligase-like ATP-grasp enzyme
LGLPPVAPETLAETRRMTLDEFCQEAAKEKVFVFNALHGGEGEDGRVQAKLNEYGLAYNGSDVKASHLCMDKYETGEVIDALKDPLLVAAPKFMVAAKQPEKAESIWADAVKKLGTTDILVKPQGDGCSTGVVRLHSAEDLKKYMTAVKEGRTSLPAGTLANQPTIVDLPARLENILFEPFIVTDEIFVKGLDLVHKPDTGWIELTVGVLEEGGAYHALSPSITVAQGNVLSVEEKFQGGTGVNLTPPPSSIISEKQIALIKTKIEKAAKALGIEGYSRIDIFFNTKTDQTLVIEANTLPGLTPSTVIYHQALAEVPPYTPQTFLAKLVDFGIKRRASRK